MFLPFVYMCKDKDTKGVKRKEGVNLVAMGDGLLTEGARGHLTFLAGCHVSTWQQEHRPATILTHQTCGKRSIQRGGQLERERKQENEPDLLAFLPKAVFCPEWIEWWPNKSRIGPQLPESAHVKWWLLACAARVTILGLCVCLSPLVLSHYRHQIGS